MLLFWKRPSEVCTWRKIPSLDNSTGVSVDKLKDSCWQPSGITFTSFKCFVFACSVPFFWVFVVVDDASSFWSISSLGLVLLEEMFLNFFPVALLWLMVLVPCASFFVTFMSSAILTSQVHSQSRYNFLSCNTHNGMSVSCAPKLTHRLSLHELCVFWHAEQACRTSKTFLKTVVTIYFITLGYQHLHNLKSTQWFVNRYGTEIPHKIICMSSNTLSFDTDQKGLPVDLISHA